MKRITRKIPHLQTVSFYNFLLKVFAVFAYIIILSVIFGVIAEDNNERGSFQSPETEKISTAVHVASLVADSSSSDKIAAKKEKITAFADMITDEEKDIVINKLKNIKLTEKLSE
ncbi:MAG: hypothetical protein ACYTFY_21670 [Planctomycetota bacterium]|jgi:hypothetical protein